MDRIARIKVLWLIKREEAAIRITDGTENPSPPGESLSLISENPTPL
jgi:hypothetical protein